MLHLVRFRVYRVCLITIYACGLRLLEGARLQVAQVDSARGLVHVTGKGQYDRYGPLPPPTGAASLRKTEAMTVLPPGAETEGSVTSGKGRPTLTPST